MPNHSESVLNILTTELQAMLVALKKDTPENFRRKANNFLLSQFDPNVLFYTVFTSSFESKSGNSLENCAKAIARLRYGPDAVPHIIKGLGATDDDIANFKPGNPNAQYIVTRKSLSHVEASIRSAMVTYRAESGTDFTANDVTNPQGLLRKLREVEDPVSKFLCNLKNKKGKPEFNPILNQEDALDDQLGEAIIARLNRALVIQLYEDTRFKGVSLSEKVKRELEQKRKSKALNRVLLEQAYSNELQPKHSGITQSILRDEILSSEYPYGKLTSKPVDLFIQVSKTESICMEVKLGGDLDSSNAPAQLAKFLTTCAITGQPQVEGYFATIYNKDGEGKQFTGTVRSYLANDMILAGSHFWTKILPTGISFDEFVRLYHEALEAIGMNSAIGKMVDAHVPVSESKKAEMVEELAE